MDNVEFTYGYRYVDNNLWVYSIFLKHGMIALLWHELLRNDKSQQSFTLLKIFTIPMFPFQTWTSSYFSSIITVQTVEKYVGWSSRGGGWIELLILLKYLWKEWEFLLINTQ